MRPFVLLIALGVCLLALLLTGGTIPAEAPPRVWSLRTPTEVTIERLVIQLGSDSFREREAASRALLLIGEQAVPVLNRVLRSRDAEIRRRAKLLIEVINAPAIALRRWGNRVRVDESDSRRPVISVNLDGLVVTDTDLSYLKGQKSLRQLTVRCGRVTDAGLIYLKGLGNVEELSFITCSGVSDAGLRHLKGLSKLHTLQISGSKVTDRGLVHLTALTQLSALDLAFTAVTDAGLVHLKACKNLRLLSLNHAAGITDSGLAHLKELKHLFVLDLSGTRVTDAGLVHLKGLRGLRILALHGTNVTPQGIANLKKALPELEIGH